MRAVKDVLLFVASEPRGRKRNQVDPLRDGRVSAYGLIDLKWQVFCNLSGTAGFV